MWLLRTDAEGDSLWSHSFGGRLWDGARSVVQTPDGGFALAGFTGSYGAGAFDMWLVKTDANGDSLWSRTYGGGSYDEAYALQQTLDGGFILCGYTGSFGDGYENGWLVKTDSAGALEWHHPYGQGLGVHAEDVCQLDDSGYVVSGIYQYESLDAQAWLIRTDGNGDSLWSRQWGDGQVSDANALALSSDGSYVLGGITNRNLHQPGTGDAWLLKTERDPLDGVEHRMSLPYGYSLKVYPNPFNSVCTIAYTLPRSSNVQVIVYDVTGRNVQQLLGGQQEAGVGEVVFDADGLASGVYFARFMVRGIPITSQKLLLLK
jgi:hypothetical protein